MHLSTGLLPWLAAITPVFAFSTPQYPPVGVWKPAGPGDDRSPCPGLNALANHGLIPRNGRDLTMKAIADAAQKAMSVDPSLIGALFNGTIKLGLGNEGGQSFNLTSLNKHNVIEHDGSLSRADASTGNDHSFNQKIWDSFIRQFNGSDTITLSSASQARKYRIEASKESDPSFTFETLQKVLSGGETALYLGVFGYLDKGNISVRPLQEFFEFERLPFKSGWTPSKSSLNATVGVTIITELLKLSGEELVPGQEPTEEQVAAVLLGPSS